MDPSNRITLEAVYQPGRRRIAIGTIKGSNAGVFIGVSSSDYSVLLNNQRDQAIHP